MNFHVVTLFPEVIEAYTNASILGRGQKDKKFSGGQFIKIFCFAPTPHDAPLSLNNFKTTFGCLVTISGMLISLFIIRQPIPNL